MASKEVVNQTRMDCMAAIYALRKAVADIEKVKGVCGDEKELTEAFEKIAGNNITGKLGAIDDLLKFVKELDEI